jgi:hypothetical protein
MPALKRERRRRSFVSWNFSFDMVNVHVLNLPLVLAGTVFGAGARPFEAADLHAGLCVALAYSLVYLFLLDRLGVHIYPMFSPRTHACAFTYTAIITLYFGVYNGWNLLLETSAR